MGKYDGILEKDEKVVLELKEGQKVYHPASKLHTPMVLTNRRLILVQNERIVHEVPLSKIAEVHGETGFLAGWSRLKLKLSDGSEDEVTFWTNRSASWILRISSSGT